MFNHILFPTDGSENSEQALLKVISLANRFKIKVTVLNAYDIVLGSAAIGMYEYYADLKDKMKENAEEIVKKVNDKLKNMDINTQGLIMEESAGPAIVEVAKQEECDLIVIGTRGLSGFKTFLLGSVSHYVVHHTDVPVLLIPNKK